jgi:hypothetical protein
MVPRRQRGRRSSSLLLRSGKAACNSPKCVALFKTFIVNIGKEKPVCLAVLPAELALLGLG